MANSANQEIEKFQPEVRQSGGLVTRRPTLFGHGSESRSAVNATATLTAAQVAGGYITTTSGSAVTMTLPTGTLLGAQIGAMQGDVIDLYIDNTAGSNTVTMAVATNAVQSDWDTQITNATASVTPATITPLTIASGVTGMARFTLMFSSSTAYTFSRTA